jgi:lactoylglutathione lyase
VRGSVDDRPASIVLFAGDLDRSVLFYRALGIPLEDEDHGDGRLHAACDLNGVHVAVIGGVGAGGAVVHRSPGSTFVGFWVDSLDETISRVTATGAPVVAAHEVCPWGCRYVVADPDGRAVEINQEGHCP